MLARVGGRRTWPIGRKTSSTICVVSDTAHHLLTFWEQQDVATPPALSSAGHKTSLNEAQDWTFNHTCPVSRRYHLLQFRDPGPHQLRTLHKPASTQGVVYRLNARKIQRADREENREVP